MGRDGEISGIRMLKVKFTLSIKVKIKNSSKVLIPYNHLDRNKRGILKFGLNIFFCANKMDQQVKLLVVNPETVSLIC